ncbi:MAG: methionine aminopeptidase [Gemmatimonadetes bacterium]|nr:methionine aminopeptidase [Gemmatimonadota bacterium]
MSIETEEELLGMQRAGRAVAEALKAMRQAVRAGVTTAELDEVCERVLRRHGARGAPRLVYGFPGTACISVNDETVHGVPGERVLVDGDLVTLDVTAELDGYFADAAVTVPVGPPSPLARRLAECAEAAFHKGLGAVRADAPLSSVGAEVEREVRRRGFRVVRDLCGHGIGRTIHEPPQVPNFYDRGTRGRMTPGLVFALEPIVSAGSPKTRTDADRWTIRTADGSLTAHYEHTVVVTRGEALILTAAA